MVKTNYNEIKVAAARTALFNNIKDVQDEINIHDVLKLSSGENLPTHKMIDGNYPVFGGGGETGLTHNIFNVDFETLAIGRVGARCGCVFKVPKKSWVTDNALYALSFDKRFLLDFLIHYLSYVDLNQYANRAAQPVISLKRISSINFPLIDVEKQKAFIEIIEHVEKGETYFGNEYSELNNALKSVDRIDELQDELTYQLTQLDNLNQAILKEAVQGKLVPQDKNDEPASELLKRIKVERAKSGKKEKPLSPIKPEEIPFDIPENWVWCRLGDLRDFRYSLSYGVLVPGNEVPDGIPFVRVQDLDFADRGLLPSKRISLNIEKQFAKTRLVGGEILICVVGSIGKVALAPDNWIGGNIARAVCRFMPNAGIDRKYIYYCLTSPFIQNFFLGGQKSINPTLNVNILETTLIPLPPLSEQKRIVAEIEKQLAKTKQLKEHIIANQQATEQLLKALLHQAFEVREMETTHN